jgi:hypothetical protein
MSGFTELLRSIADNARITPDYPNDPRQLGRFEYTIRLSRNFIQRRQDAVRHRCKYNYQTRSSYFFEALLQFLKALTIKLNGIRSRWADYRHRFTQKLARDR